MELGAKVAAHRKVLILSGGLQSPHVGDSFLFTSTRFPCPTNTYTRNLCTDPLHQPGVTEAKQALPLAVFISRLLEGVRQNWAPPADSAAESPPASAGDTAPSLGWEDPLRGAWQPAPVSLPGEPHGLWPAGLLCPWGCRVRRDLVTKQRQQCVRIKLCTRRTFKGCS